MSTEKWVNARIGVLVDLDDVSPDSTPEEKMEAAERVLDDLMDGLAAEWTERACFSVGWEIAE